MVANYPNFNINGYNNPFTPMQQPQQPFYKVLPISNRKEADNIPVDLSGHPTYFHNQTNNEIYVKQFDVRTGLATIQEFQRIDHSTADGKEQYSDDLKSIRDQLNSIQKLLTHKEGKKNA